MATAWDRHDDVSELTVLGRRYTILSVLTSLSVITHFLTDGATVISVLPFALAGIQGGLIGVVTVRRHHRGRRWRNAIPNGYQYGLLGVGSIGLFLTASIGLGWPLSVPTARVGNPGVVGLAAGFGFLVSAPVWATVRGSRTPSLTVDAVSAGLILAAVSFAFAPINPLANPLVFVDDPAARVVGPLGLVVFPAVVTATALRVDSWIGPIRGLVAMIVLWPSVASLATHGYHELIVAPLLLALTGELLLNPPRSPMAFRRMSLLGPPVFCAGYLAVAAITTGIAWPGSLWLGAALSSSVTGWATALVLTPR